METGEARFTNRGEMKIATKGLRDRADAMEHSKDVSHLGILVYEKWYLGKSNAKICPDV